MILQQTLKDLQVHSKDGGSLISHRTLFSSDSKNLFVIAGHTVFIYNTQTCVCTGKIVTPSTEAIANIALDRYKDDRLVICTVRGEIYRASVSTREILEEHNQKLKFSPKNWPNPLTSIVNFFCPGDDFYFILATTQEDVLPYLYSVTSGGDRPLFMDRLFSDVVNSLHSVACAHSLNGDFVAAIQENALWVRDCYSKSNKRHLYGERKLTCVAVHPYEFICATGDDTGRIVLWGNPLRSNTPAKTVFHWHTLPVNDLCFTVDASQIFSGGGECTLVKWDTSHTVNKRTLPRMGLPIRHVSVSPKNALAAVSHADNSIQLIDGQNCVVGTIQNITQCYIPEGTEDLCATSTSLGGINVFKAGVTLDPNSQALVMNGKPGHLQCYSFIEDKHLYDLDITHQNYITAERYKVIPFAEVDHVTFSKNGTWLATAESRFDEGIFTEIRLKFWKFNRAKQIFTLNTSIEWPHESGVNSLKIQPIDEEDPAIIAVSSGGDRRFKTWGVVHDPSIHGKSEWWNCENVGFYRNLPSGPASFSRDGSLLAVAFGHILTLWTTDNHQMKGALSHQRLPEYLKLIEFGNQLSSHLVICCSESTMAVWDVITFSLLWAIPLQVECLTVDPYSDVVAAFSFKKHAYFFQPDKPVPLAVHNNVSKSKVISSIFVPNERFRQFGLKSILYYINLSQEVCAFLPKNLELEDGENPLLTIQGDRKSLESATPFAQLIAAKTVSEVPLRHGKLNPNPAQFGLAGAHVIREIIDSSPHTMPSVSFFCDQLLNAVTVRKSASERFEELENLVIASHVKRKLNKNDKKSNKYENVDMTMDIDESKEVKVKLEQEQTRISESLDLQAISNEDRSWITNIFS